MKQTDIRELIALAIEARKQAYSPYSEYKVGCAILTAGGEIFTGANVENASYGAGICAERSAATSAVSAGARVFKAIAVVGWKDGSSDLAYPCGVCRQFLNEFSTSETDFYIARSEEDYLATTMGELLPHSFGPENLDVEV